MSEQSGNLAVGIDARPIFADKLVGGTSPGCIALPHGIAHLRQRHADRRTSIEPTGLVGVFDEIRLRGNTR